MEIFDSKLEGFDALDDSLEEFDALDRNLEGFDALDDSLEVFDNSEIKQSLDELVNIVNKENMIKLLNLNSEGLE